ncbi:hypothetical protein SGM_5074 [Streptomyces griseoaurantiacus M045]|uniref:Uncharacterized protein n=1 Tax=Streptomyces griseoaurantiacus M045 TaxID=996637 RepID=F3NPZ9_9ACTN|nr:hypothetical protein SGM_5074 [Streptomyces griseoaurantiacus M045]
MPYLPAQNLSGSLSTPLSAPSRPPDARRPSTPRTAEAASPGAGTRLRWCRRTVRRASPRG